MSSTDEFAVEHLGRWGDPIDFAVEGERTVAYARATNDPIAAHLDATQAPPVFAVVPAMSVMADTTMSVVPDALMMRILHGEHDFRFHRPLVPGETVSVRARPVGIQGKASGTVVTTQVETRSETGELVNEQYFIGFFRGGTFEGSQGEPSPDHAFPESLRGQDPEAVVQTPFDSDQTFRYAEPAGDPMPIHLDEEFAQAMGLPGIIMHGLCTNAMLSHVVLAHAGATDDPARLRRLAVRFSKPGIPGDTMTTSIWRGEDTVEGRTVYHFEAVSSDGEHLVRDGLAELDPA